MKPLQPMPLLFPDIASLLVVDVRAGLPADVTCGVDLTGWTRPGQHVQIYRFGGNQIGRYEDARLQVNCRAETENAAHDLAQATRYRLTDAPLRIPALTQVDPDGGLTWLPDPDDRMPRYLFTITARVLGHTP